MLEVLEENGFKLWKDVVVSGNEYVYIWANSKAALGVGRTSASVKNKRVNPSLSKKSIIVDKDAGKKFLAAFIAKETQEKMCLYAKTDTSKKISKNTSTLETTTKALITQGNFLIINNITFSKIDFNTKIVLPKVQSIFGIDSIEDIVASLARSDGDLWSRMYSHKITKEALNNIIDELLLTNED